VQRYDAQLGLPVRRPAGKPRGSVVATRAEIDAWVAASPIRATLRLTRVQDLRHDPQLVRIWSGIREMRLLREQMMALRAETDRALHLLITSLQTLREMSSVERLEFDEALKKADSTLHRA